MHVKEPMPESEARSTTPSDAALTEFFRESPAAAAAAKHLRSGAEVGVTFTDVPGNWRFHAPSGKPALETGAPLAPDFELRLGPGAVRDLCAHPKADIGDLGILFFEHIVTRQPENQIRVKLHSGLVKLTMRGWLTVMAQGGPKVVRWLAHKGLSGPSAVASALIKLKG
jgi:hypothetical protein